MPIYESNPYQKLLLHNLKALGLDVQEGGSGVFSILRSVICNLGADAIHLHWLTPFLIGNSKIRTIAKSILTILQLIILQLLKIKIVWTVHNLKNHENRFTNIERFFSRIVAKRADAILAHSESAKRDIRNAFDVDDQEKIAIIPHGNYLGYYKNTLTKEESRSRLNLSPHNFTFLYFGKIRDYKGVQELIDSFIKLNKSDAKLIIAGKPNNNEISNSITYKARQNKNILLVLQLIPEDDIQLFMNAADVAVLPYRDVLTSGTLMLGMSFRKPIIAPRLGCIPDVLKNGGCFFYDPEDADGLFRAMKLSMTSKHHLQNMGDRNFILAQKNSWSLIARSIFKIYQNHLSDYTPSN
ncbi:MAG TPA: glycosyltransferase [Desulfobacterales bacterium]|nr:glycosyltransferase [Desulfobacterales bacterium]